MAAGCPVIAANAGGIPDIVTDGENGFLFSPAEDDAMIGATQRLLANQIQRETLRKAARAEAERWSWAAATQQLETYYEQVLSMDELPKAA